MVKPLTGLTAVNHGLSFSGELRHAFWYPNWRPVNVNFGNLAPFRKNPLLLLDTCRCTFPTNECPSKQYHAISCSSPHFYRLNLGKHQKCPQPGMNASYKFSLSETRSVICCTHLKIAKELWKQIRKKDVETVAALTMNTVRSSIETVTRRFPAYGVPSGLCDSRRKRKLIKKYD